MIKIAREGNRSFPGNTDLNSNIAAGNIGKTHLLRSVPRLRNRLLLFGFGSDQQATISSFSSSGHVSPDSAVDYIMSCIVDLKLKDIPLQVVLKKTATQFLILKHSFEAQHDATSSNQSHSLLSTHYMVDDLVRSPITLRQAFYFCKPLFATSGQSIGPSTSENNGNTIEKAIPTKFVHEEQEVEMILEAKSASCSTSYVYNCINSLADTMKIRREHLFLEAEGKSLFSVQPYFHGGPCASDTTFRQIVNMFKGWTGTSLITSASIRQIQSSLVQLLALVSSSAPHRNIKITVAAIEKEGIYDQILQRLRAKTALPTTTFSLQSSSSTASAPLSMLEFGKDASLKVIPADHLFEELIMNPILQKRTGFPRNVRELNISTNVIFLVCLKGFPCRSSRKLLAVLQQFKSLLALSSLSPSSFSDPLVHQNTEQKEGHQAHISLVHQEVIEPKPENLLSYSQPSPILAFVDCNPSGILILNSLLSIGSSTAQAPHHPEFPFSVRWCALRPSMIAIIPESKIKFQKQPFSDRDVAIISTLENSRHKLNWAGELEAMKALSFKLELQCLL